MDNKLYAYYSKNDNSVAIPNKDNKGFDIFSITTYSSKNADNSEEIAYVFEKNKKLKYDESKYQEKVKYNSFSVKDPTTMKYHCMFNMIEVPNKSLTLYNLGFYKKEKAPERFTEVYCGHDFDDSTPMMQELVRKFIYNCEYRKISEELLSGNTIAFRIIE